MQNRMNLLHAKDGFCEEHVAVSQIVGSTKKRPLAAERVSQAVSRSHGPLNLSPHREGADILFRVRTQDFNLFSIFNL